MNSIFVLTKTNFDFFKTGKREGSFWKIYGRACLHHGDDPIYILHGLNTVDGSMKHVYDDYYHIDKKPLYSISHYKVSELEDISTRLHLPLGTKAFMHATIASYLKTNL